MWIVDLIVGLVLGFLLGFLVVGSRITKYDSHLNVSGQLIVSNQDEDEEPYIFLELDEPVQALCQKEYARLRVNTKNYLSRK